MVKATPLGGWGWEGPVPGPGKRAAAFCSLGLGCFGKFPLFFLVSPKKVEHSQILLLFGGLEKYMSAFFCGGDCPYIVGFLVVSWLNNPI